MTRKRENEERAKKFDEDEEYDDTKKLLKMKINQIRGKEKKSQIMYTIISFYFISNFPFFLLVYSRYKLKITKICQISNDF